MQWSGERLPSPGMKSLFGRRRSGCEGGSGGVGQPVRGSEDRTGAGWACGWTALGAWALLGWTAVCGAGGFSFSGPELFPIDQGIGLLRVADLDGDGLQDLVLANNTRARIALLYNRTGRPAVAAREEPADEGSREPNELPPDARFEIRSIASEKRISALEVGDLNQDGRPDLVYFGDPHELVVQYNEGDRRWSAPVSWPLRDVPFSPNVLAVVDPDGDGRPDVFVLGEYQIHWFRQSAEGGLQRADPIPLGEPAYSLQVLDVDGDGRRDLLLVNWESADPIRVLFQRADGTLGPEVYFRFPAIRAYWADRAGTGGPAYLVGIGQASGRALLARFELAAPRSTGPLRQGWMEVFALPRTEKVRRGVVWADADGDGRWDLLAADPEQGHLLIWWAGPDGGLAALRRFPSLMGVTDVVVGDWDGDGRPELFLLSPDEKALGITHADTRAQVPFPTLMPLQGRPLGMALGRPAEGRPPELAVVTEVEGRRLVRFFQAGRAPRSLPLAEGFKGQLTAVVWQDADADGMTDLLLLASYERIKVLRQRAPDEFEELDVPPPGGVLENPWLAVADLTGDGRPELLLGQKNLVRAVRLQSASGVAAGESAWSFQVLEQINAPSRESRLVAATVVPGTGGPPLLGLLDAGTRTLQLARRETNGLWQLAEALVLPRTDFTSMQPLPAGEGGVPRLALHGLQAGAILRWEGPVWSLRELDQYETPVRNGYLRDVLAGDLDHDGRKEWVFLETARHYVDIVRWAGDRLLPGDRWPVFEERSYQRSAGMRMEPREALIADVTGDGRNDLILVVHDRVLVYPQEAPAAPASGGPASDSSMGRRHSGYTASGN